MAAPTYSVTLNELLSIIGNGLNEQDSPVGGGPVQLTGSPGLRVGQVLAAGDNNIDPPQSPLPTAKVCIILPSDATILKLKNAGGDSGYQLGYLAGLGYILGIGSAAGADGKIGSFILNAAAQTPVTLWWL